MNITIIGAGNFGSVLSIRFSQKHRVVLYTKGDLSKISNSMTLINTDTNKEIVSRIYKITNSLEEAIHDAEYIFITYPAFLFESLSKELVPLLSDKQHLVCVPGSGGFELYFKEAIEKGCTLTGLQRTPSVARIIEKGKSVKESGVRDCLKVATIPNAYNETISGVLSDIFGMKVKRLENYLNITLVNSNSILHTSRLYSIFQNYNGEGYESLPLFYEDWDMETSNLLVNMDTELFQVLDNLEKIGISINGITTLLSHYESKDACQLTNKIKSIESLKKLETPNIYIDSKYYPNLESRYFTADFPYGLDIIISFSKALGVNTPNLVRVSDWYHNILGDKFKFDLSKFGFFDIISLISFYR